MLCSKVLVGLLNPAGDFGQPCAQEGGPRRRPPSFELDV